MSEQNQIEYSLTIDTEYATTTVRKLETTIIRCLGYAEQLTGDTDIGRGLSAAINKGQEAIIVFRSATLAANAFKAAAGPVGWIYFGVTALATGISFGHMMTDIGE
jgi:hypothetical protein